MFIRLIYDWNYHEQSSPVYKFYVRLSMLVLCVRRSVLLKPLITYLLTDTHWYIYIYIYRESSEFSICNTAAFTDCPPPKSSSWCRSVPSRFSCVINDALDKFRSNGGYAFLKVTARNKKGHENSIVYPTDVLTLRGKLWTCLYCCIVQYERLNTFWKNNTKLAIISCF